MKSGFITTEQLCKRYNISKRTLFRWRDAKKHSNPFPEPKLCGQGYNNRWQIDDVMKWEEIGFGDDAKLTG